MIFPMIFPNGSSYLCIFLWLFLTQVVAGMMMTSLETKRILMRISRAGGQKSSKQKDTVYDGDLPSQAES